MADIECLLGPEDLLHWKKIVDRKLYPIEKLVKTKKGDRNEEGSASKFFVFASYILFMWLVFFRF